MKISIIIPVYNAAEYITQTLDGIYAQSIGRSELEVICYLDKCTDDSGAVISAWKRQNSGLCLRIIRGLRNAGPSVARNRAIAVARGEFIHFMDADDTINIDFYQNMYMAATGASADLATCNFYNQRRPQDSIIYHGDYVLRNPQDKIDDIKVDVHGYMVRYLIRRTFWDKNKFKFPENMRFCEDWLLANHMVYAANRVVTVSGALYMYRFRRQSLVGQSRTNPLYQAQGRAAGQSVKDFLAAHHLQPHQRSVRVTDWRLLGIQIVKILRTDTHSYVRLFGRILFLRASGHIKYFRGDLFNG